jgi:glycosyltransferase involved in cell wall biosynthesis
MDFAFIHGGALVTRTPTVTVLIPTFNRGDFLAECLDSIQAQTLAPAQIIVVNDGSTDRTPEVLKPYRDRIEYLETPQLGKPAALNAGLERVTGEYLWIFDDDDVALPEALARFVEPLERHPEHGFSYSTFFYTTSRPEDNRIGAIVQESTIPDVRERGFLIPLLEANFLGGAALFARTSCYAHVGNFDTRLTRSQDYEMAIRIARRFTGIRVPGSATFHYRQHEGLRGSTHDRFQAGTRLKKWLQYDQMIFRDLYRQLPLNDYLPPGHSVADSARQAHLQRLAILASKLLLAEIREELNAIAKLPDRTPLSARERQLLRGIVATRPYYATGNLGDHVEFFDEVRRLAQSSGSMRLMRQELLACLPERWSALRPWKNPRQAIKTIQRTVRLYLPGRSGVSGSPSAESTKP